MTRKAFKKTVTSAARDVLRWYGINYWNITVDRHRQIIAIGDETVGSWFFAQGEDAEYLLRDIPDDINAKTWMLFYLDSAGAL